MCSVAGGQTCSAATTADGRLFKWGLNSHGSSRSLSDEHMGEEPGSDPTEEIGGAAIEVFTPRQVAGVGMEVRAISTDTLQMEKCLPIKI